ncbi:MAG: MlaD family protein [Verrucomicrobiota bacterium]
MKESRLQWKVGLFVLICLLLTAVLVILFNKRITFARTYSLRMKTTNVGLLMSKAAVVMSGVRVGTVNDVTLDPEGRTVTVVLKILQRYSIHGDARFAIDQIGFLGDQFVAIVPRENKAPLLKDFDEVFCEEPFNLQELARSGVGLVKRVDETVQKLNVAITRIDEVVLSQQTLTNFTSAVGNFRLVSERALSAVAGFDQVVQTNAVPVSLAVSNLGLFVRELNEVANGLSNLVDTNRAQLTSTIKNVESVSASINNLVSNLNTGRGLAGFLIKDEEVKVQIGMLMGNLTTLSSNLNKYGLLYKPKPVKTRASTPAPYTGRQP